VSLFVVLLLSVCLNTAAQLSLKHGMKTLNTVNLQNSSPLAWFYCIVTNVFMMTWVALLTPSMVLWLKALSMADLGFAYPFQSLTLVFISLGSIILLKEHLTTKQWTGILLILLGIFLVVRT
jgi:undecaprenyl phosphate-alpha-L-ara4N flippase subunit ArnE